MKSYQAWFTGYRWEVEELEEGKWMMPIAKVFENKEDAQYYADLMNGECKGD